MPTDFIADLEWRGLVHQTTGLEPLRTHLLAGPRRAYVGFDPTAPSLTIGNLVGIVALVRFALAGHDPVIVVGGATGLIGDPSGKSAERTLNTRETVAANVAGQTRIYHNVWRFAAGLAGTTLGEPPIHNNNDWFEQISFIDALRDIGKHFSVNMMIQKESVKERLNNRDQGISYTEFSYMLLQAYDYQHLWENEGVTLQMGGSDQFGNIVCGIDLIRRQLFLEYLKRVVATSETESHFAEWLLNHPSVFDISDTCGGWSRYTTIRAFAEYSGAAASDHSSAFGGTRSIRLAIPRQHRDQLDRHSVFGLTWPLVTKADGGKFGKTESGAVWLTADRTSPYAFYQFWLNTADADVVRFLKTFTILPHAEISRLEAAHAANPGAREAHRALAEHMTTLLHGPEETANARNAASALFSGSVADLPAATLEEALAGAPSSSHDPALLAAGVPLLDFLVTTGLASSKRESREFLGNGSVLVNGRKAGAEDRLTAADLLHGRFIALRRGKKNWHLTRWP